jgi:tetratricopeptide (TPR) repeat protein
MDLISAAKARLNRFVENDDLSEHEMLASQIDRVSSWMMILGTVRLICALAEYVKSYLEMSRTSLFSYRIIIRFLQENPPVVVLGFAWPLVLGILLRRTGRAFFLPAAAVAFFIMSLGGILNILAGISVNSDSHIYFGSFDVFWSALLHLSPAALVRAIMGLVQLLLEFATAVSAWALARQLRHSSLSECSGSAPGASRRSMHGRLALYVSLAFLVLNIRLPVWSVYLEILNRSRLVREFVLQNDVRRHVPYHTTLVETPVSRGDREFERSLVGALRHGAANQYAEAKDDYLRIISQTESMSPDSQFASQRNHHLSRALNNLGWLLATCADESLRDPEQSLSYAKRAVEIAPEEGTYWNTLGVAYYRAQNWQEAMKALEHSMELRNNGDSFDWFFVAMIHAKQGRLEQAREWYDKAVAWHQANLDGEEELYRFRVEAATVLGLPKPPPPPTVRRGVPDDFRFRAIPSLERRRLRSGPL